MRRMSAKYWQTLTRPEVYKYAIELLKNFDKVDPEKVSSISNLPYVALHFADWFVFFFSNILSLDAAWSLVPLFSDGFVIQLDLDSHFIHDLGLDSLDCVEIVMFFEDTFGETCVRACLCTFRLHYIYAHGLLQKTSDKRASSLT